MKGNVGKYRPEDGMGDIHPDDGRGDVTFLESDIVGRKSIPKDQRVEFDLEQGPKGPRAVDVRSVDDGVESPEEG